MVRLLIVFLSLSFARLASADEGMWTFDQIPRAEIQKRFGVDLTESWLDHLRLSTVRVGTGCSGSFVSADGLVLTNHHCAQNGLAELSETGHDLLEQGFVARTRAEERPLPSYQIDVLVGIEDVTAQVERATTGLDETRASQARRQLLIRLEKEAEDASRNDPTGPLTVESVTLYEGGRYCLYRYRRYNDVRLVFAPEMSIAQFGGDPDNFQFPRWDLDMALLRVYENGRPASTPQHLTVKFAGARDGEPVFAAGTPGGTDRQLTVEQLRTLRDVELPVRLLITSELRGRLIQFSKTGVEPWRIAQDPIADLENGIKVRRGELTALLDENLFAQKQGAEADLKKRAAAAGGSGADVAAAFDAIAKAETTDRATWTRRYFLESGRGIQGDLFAYARTLVRAAAERQLPNERRLREYRETALPRLRQRLVAPNPIHPELETLELSFWIERLREWLGPDDATVKKLLGRESPDSLAARLVRGTRLADAATRERLWQGGQAAVMSSKDPMIEFMRRLDPDARAVRLHYQDSIEPAITSASERLAHARFRVYGTSLYPDATGTLRLNPGRVQGWRENDVAVAPFTTFRTLYPRVTGADPFAVPSRWLAARGRLALDTPFNYATNNDIVGGNSGSPLVNARGELVGLIFDGNIHSIAGSYWFDTAKNRAVAVHPAAIREALAKIYGAPALVSELGGDARAAR